MQGGRGLFASEIAAPAARAELHRKRGTCRVCGGAGVRPFLDLGRQPLANSFLGSAEEAGRERFFPLEVYYCDACSLVQLLDVIDPEVLFRDYIYVTGTSSTIARHNERYADAVTNRLRLGAGDLVVEAASNDGSLLGCFARRGVRVLGVEPARNIAALARASGIETVEEFFDVEMALRVRASHGPAAAVIGNNVLAHVDDPVRFLRGFRELLAPDGVGVFEVPYVKELVDRLEYDTIYHEHLSYFSVTALLRLAEAAGLRLECVDAVPVHGGSLRVWTRRDDAVSAHAPETLAIAAREHAQGLDRFDTYLRLAEEVKESRNVLRALLGRLRGEGKTVAGYGAPAKGNTLLNYCGVTQHELPFTVDRNPLKVGMLTPGMHIPVARVEALLERQPDYVLILAWNFAAEIMEQQREYAARGGRFIVPIPKARIVQP